MKQTFRGTVISVIQGDLTEQTTDAIVNPTNGALSGTHGLDAWIHRTAGIELQTACRALQHPNDDYGAGWAGPTPGGKLPATWVIHTVPPVWQNGTSGEMIQLERCYINTLQCAREQGIRTLSFPSIGTGRNGFPLDRAAYVAFNTINRAIAGHPDTLDLVQVLLLEAADFQTVSAIGEEVMQTMTG